MVRKRTTTKQSNEIYFWVWEEADGDCSVSQSFTNYQDAVDAANECAIEMGNDDSDSVWYIVKSVIQGKTTKEIQFES